jgi:protein-disulfide isomerase
MSTPPRSTKKERRDAARAHRLEAERAAAAAAQRTRRLRILGALVTVAAIVVVAAVLIGGSGGSAGTPKRQAGETVAGQRLSAAMLDGIPQSGITLGRPSAKVTVVEFADLQCPICRQFSQQILPTVIQDHVRNGQAKVELRLVDILDRGGVTDSARMAAVAYGAQQQNKLWNFVDLQHFNQGEEDTGYATDAYIKNIASGVRGLDVPKAFARPHHARGDPGPAGRQRPVHPLRRRRHPDDPRRTHRRHAQEARQRRRRVDRLRHRTGPLTNQGDRPTP